MSVTPSDKLVMSRCRLLTREPWYGTIALGMDWIESRALDTMGVRIINGGHVQCLYSPDFVMRRTIPELCSVIMHELEHLVRLHCVRVADRHPQVWNLAADMCVNGTESSPRIEYQDDDSNRRVLPFDSEPPDPKTGKKPKCVFIPQGWANDGTSEEFYDKLLQEAKQFKKKGKGGKKGSGGSGEGEGDGDGEGDGEGGGGGGMIFGDKYGTMFDDHNVWNDTDVSADEARQVVYDMVREANEKSRGTAPGHLADAITALAKPIVRWRELLRRYIGRYVGNRRQTWARQNRRRQSFGNPGHTLHAAAKVCCIIDTSGSIGKSELEQFFAEIDMIAHKSKVSILQWDYAFQGYNGNYRRSDWRKFIIKGRGGTDMAAPIEWLIENRLVPDLTVMLTDGYCNWADDKQFPLITCITSAQDQVKPCPWGHVVWLGRNN